MFQTHFVNIKNQTYVVFVFTAFTVRGQRTHTNAGGQKRSIKMADIFLTHFKKESV